ncbi:hypothetical protein PHSY_002219 [Pseudozyma hubeiensis SY62]|uniref:Uncharacterized protein n=1 Tax=Pseudozyma hubeiensis (strain SY62) TaxID=1305764 RepID=R9P0H7_PSEHS|nr:hypothetical protein PHSY_002219 [Pseudozyma hubeiensis SY62]GAC94646.1 hypothetical protein PHSY_002219 [Pseudozyma hubeiensis SY62]
MHYQRLRLERVGLIRVIWTVYDGWCVRLVDVKTRMRESERWDWFCIVIFDERRAGVQFLCFIVWELGGRRCCRRSRGERERDLAMGSI